MTNKKIVVHGYFNNIKEKQDCSDKEQEEYVLKDDGKYVATGKKVNIYEQIQANSDVANIHVILRKVANGEPIETVSNNVNYADVRELQDMNIHIAHDRQLQAENDLQKTIDSLPKEIKEKYNYDNNLIKEHIFNGNVANDLKSLQAQLDALNNVKKESDK